MLQRQHLVRVLRYPFSTADVSASPAAAQTARTLTAARQNAANATVNASLIKVMCKRIICMGNCDIWSMTQMDMNGTVNQRDSINYNWPLLAVTQGLLVCANTHRLLFQKLLTVRRQTYQHLCAHTSVSTSAPELNGTSAAASARPVVS